MGFGVCVSAGVFVSVCYAGIVYLKDTIRTTSKAKRAHNQKKNRKKKYRNKPKIKQKQKQTLFLWLFVSHKYIEQEFSAKRT